MCVCVCVCMCLRLPTDTILQGERALGESTQQKERRVYEVSRIFGKIQTLDEERQLITLDEEGQYKIIG